MVFSSYQSYFLIWRLQQRQQPCERDPEPRSYVKGELECLFAALSSLAHYAVQVYANISLAIVSVLYVLAAVAFFACAYLQRSTK